MKTIFDLEKEINELYIKIKKSEISLVQGLLIFENILDDYKEISNSNNNIDFEKLKLNFKRSIHKLKRIEELDKNIQSLEHQLKKLYLS